jgi:DNA-binding transcriptional LysR family regulator
MDHRADIKPGASASALPVQDKTPDNTIEQLRFLAVDDLLILMHLANDQLSVTAVAEKLSLTQPAVTQRIRKMEEVFGHKLIERKGRGIQLTAFGSAQAKRATAALTALQNQTESSIILDRTETTSQPER